jgi:hypothetical protein
MPEPIAYLCEPATYDRLKAVMRRLYDDKPLTGDQRRDLANTMHALLGGFIEYQESKS